jgi:hypothetical protein
MIIILVKYSPEPYSSFFYGYHSSDTSVQYLKKQEETTTYQYKRIMIMINPIKSLSS